MKKFKLLDRVVIGNSNEVLTVIEVNPRTVLFNSNNSSITNNNNTSLGRYEASLSLSSAILGS